MLKGGQKKLDANKDGKISGDDFRILQSKKGMKKGGNIGRPIVGASGLIEEIKSIFKKSDKKPEKKSKGGSIFSRQNYKRTGKM